MLRAAHEGDRDAVRAWRNHPQVRAASLTRHEISADEHAAWWERALADPTRRVLVYERSGVPSGSVTFFDLGAEEHRRSAWWGFYLDVEGLEARGELLPATIGVMREAIRYAFDELGLEVLHGEVLASNDSVRALNRRHGIREVETYERDVDGTPETVVRLELHAGDVRRRGGAGQGRP